MGPGTTRAYLYRCCPYACLSRPWLKSKPEKEDPHDGYATASDEI
jgi:hypothetical protein